jgi:hypothetical protein
MAKDGRNMWQLKREENEWVILQRNRMLKYNLRISSVFVDTVFQKHFENEYENATEAIFFGGNEGIANLFTAIAQGDAASETLSVSKSVYLMTNFRPVTLKEQQCSYHYASYIEWEKMGRPALRLSSQH